MRHLKPPAKKKKKRMRTSAMTPLPVLIHTKKLKKNLRQQLYLQDAQNKNKECQMYLCRTSRSLQNVREPELDTLHIIHNTQHK